MLGPMRRQDLPHAQAELLDELRQAPDLAGLGAWIRFSCRDGVRTCDGQRLADCAAALEGFAGVPHHALHGVRGASPGHRISACPIRSRLPTAMPSAKAKPGGANTMMVEPCWNQPRSWPLVTWASQGSSSGPR